MLCLLMYACWCCFVCYALALHPLIHAHTLNTLCLIIQIFSGLQAAESIYHSSKSHGVHSQRFLEDDLRQEVWSDCHAL